MLEAQSGPPRPLAPPFLVTRILNRVNAEGTTRLDPPPVPWRRLTLGGLGVAAALALGLGWWFRTPDFASPETSAPAVTVLAMDMPGLLPDADSLWALSQRWDAPLAREWEFLLADAQDAARALSAAFLPQATPSF